MVDKVVDNNGNKTLSNVKMHGEFIYASYNGYNGPEHDDSAVDLHMHTNQHGVESTVFIMIFLSYASPYLLLYCIKNNLQQQSWVVGLEMLSIGS